MNNFKDRMVAQHNDLITSVAKMDKTPLKIFELAVSCIDTENPPKDNIIYLSKTELFSFFDVSDSNKHSRFKEAVEKMQKQAFFQIKEEKDKGFKFKSIVPIPFVEWNDYNDEVKIRFDIDIMPYLIDMKKNFTQYAISDIMGLESKYSIIIYKWLSMFFNQFENYEFRNNRTKKQLESYRNPIISVRELRTMTDTMIDYSRFTDFDKRVLKNSMSEINAHTHLNVSYEKIKKGRSIDSIQFHIDKKANWKNEDYKKDNSKAQLSIEQREQVENKKFSEAATHPYTMKLINAGLLHATDMTKQNLLVGLIDHVYPIYDEAVKKAGSKSLDKHLSYVYNRKISYDDNKKNIVKYLETAAEQYFGSIR